MSMYKAFVQILCFLAVAAASGTVQNVLQLEELFVEQQYRLLPISPPVEDVLMQPYGPVVPVDWSGFPPEFAKQMYAEMDENGLPLYRVSAYEDPVTRETVFLNAYDTEVYRLEAEQGYDPYAWQTGHFNLGPGQELDAWLRWIYDPAHIAARFVLLPEVFLDAYQEAQAARELLLDSISMMRLLEDTSTNVLVAVAVDTNGAVEVEIGWPSNFTERLEIFAATDLIARDWVLARTDIETEGESFCVWPDPDASNHVQRFYLAAYADVDSDFDDLPNARETYLHGTNPDGSDTDRDGLPDGEEVYSDTDGYRTNPLRPDRVDYVLPDLAVSGPSANLEGFATFDPPTTNVPPAAGAPAVSAWMPVADRGGCLTLGGSGLSAQAGADEGMDTRFLAFGEDPDGKVLADVQILRQEGPLAAVRLPELLPADAMYLLWPRNAHGYGTPFAVNRTETWWVGPDRVSTGQSFSVYGRNLSLGGGPCKLYIEEAAAWLESESANPFKADFVLPTGLTNGTYTLWAHNGSGRAYGWSEPLELAVRDPIVWTTNIIDVTQFPYNAQGNGINNDLLAIAAALQACPTGGTVYFPAGTYLIRGLLYSIDSNKRLLGDGNTNSIIMTDQASLDGSTGNGIVHDRLENVEIRGIGFESGSNYLGKLVMARGSEDVSFVDCRFSQLGSTSGEAVVDVSIDEPVFSQNIRFEGCTFEVSGNVYCGGAQGLYFKDCTFSGLNDVHSLLVVDGARQVSITGCSARSYDDSDPSNGSGWTLGRFLKSGSGTPRNMYIAGNTTTNLCPRYAQPFYRGSPAAVALMVQTGANEYTQVFTFNDLNRSSVGSISASLGDPDVQRPEYGLEVVSWDGATGEVKLKGGVEDLLDPPTTNITVIFWDNVNQNSGEQILFEALETHYRGTVQTATSNTVQCAGLTNDLSGTVLVMAGGRGFGQGRIVASVDVQTGTATLDRPWLVEPEAGDRVLVGSYASRIAVVGNRFDGDPRAADPHELLYGSTGYTNYTASCGVSFYGGTLESVVAGNTVTDVRTGIANWSLAETNSVSPTVPLIQPNYFNLFADNTIDLARSGMFDGFVSFRGEPTQDVAVAGSVWRGNTATNLTGSALETGANHDTAWVEINIFQGNRFESDLWGIDGLERARSLVLVGNTFKGGGSGNGIVFPTNDAPVLRGNHWEDFAAVYAGSPPGGVSALPVRVVELSVSLTNAVLDIWNTGTSNLAWAAVSTNSWITITQGSGTVSNEGDAGLLSFHIDPSAIPAGVSNGTVAVVGGGHTNKLDVLYEH